MIFSEIFQRRLLNLLLIFSFILILLVTVLVGAEYDEAWITASARQAFSLDAIPSVKAVTTSGGLHFLVVGLTHGLPVSPLVVPRLLSLIAIVSVYFLLLRALRPFIKAPIEHRIIAITCVAAPGTLLLAGMGYAIVVSTLLFLSGVIILLNNERITLTNALAAGGLVGCAVATRWTFIPALPALALCVFLSRTHMRQNFGMFIVTCVTAGFVFSVFFYLQVQLLDGTGPSNGVTIAGNLNSTGVGRSLTSPARMYSFLVRFLTMMPASILFLAISGVLLLRRNTFVRRFALVLLAASVLITVAWIAISPWMHLRYIWPVFLMVAICAGIALVEIYRMASKLEIKELRLAVVAFAGLIAAAQMVVTVRMIAMGTGMQVNSAGYQHLENHFKPFHHIQEQKAIVRYLKSLDQDAIIGSVGMPAEFGALELSLLSNRDVFDYANQNTRIAGRPNYLLTHRFSAFNDAGGRWLETLGAPIYQTQGYSVFSVPEDLQVPPPMNEILIDSQLYRFSLERWVSLTWY